MSTLMQALASADQVRANLESEISVIAKEKATFINNLDALTANVTTFIDSVKGHVSKAYDDRMSALASMIGDAPADEQAMKIAAE